MPYRQGYVLVTFAVWLGTAQALSATEIEATSKIDTVIVYPDGATITRTMRVDLAQGDVTVLARDFPTSLDPSSLRVAGNASVRLVVGSIDARVPKPQPATRPELEQRIEALRDERATLDDRIAAETARRHFAERFASDVPLGLGDKGDARPIADWRGAFDAIGEEIAAVDTAIRDAKLRQRAIDGELARLGSEMKDNPPRKMEVRIELSAENAGPAMLSVSYTVRGARWVPMYDARLDSGNKERKPSLELVRRAEIVQQTGEDWSDVALAVSTIRTAKGGNAPELPPLIVRLREPVASLPAPPPVAAYAPANAPNKVRTQTVYDRAAKLVPGAGDEDAAASPAEERQATIETGGYQAVFHIPGRVSVGTGEGARSLRILTASIAPELLVRATPALDDTAYLEAAFKQADEAPLLPGRIALYRDGIYVGRGQMSLVPKDETARLGFGADEKVKVVRVPVRKFEGSAGIISSDKTDEREYKITVRNGHDTPVRVTVEDQLPVSETADVEVEMLSFTTAPTQRDVSDRRGTLAWTFEPAPGEAKTIRLGWRVRWPANRTLAYDTVRP